MQASQPYKNHRSAMHGWVHGRRRRRRAAARARARAGRRRLAGRPAGDVGGLLRAAIARQPLGIKALARPPRQITPRTLLAAGLGP
jgi:hypothetical protein